MLSYLLKNTATPLRKNLSTFCNTRVLTKLITAELEGLYAHPMMPYDYDDLYNFAKGWIDSCLIYQRDYTLMDVYEISRRIDYDTAIDSYFAFTEDDPMQEDRYIRNENGRRLFVEIYSLCIYEPQKTKT